MRRRKYEEFEEDNGTVLRYARHDNGGGFVESHAHVDPAAYVAENAYVDRGAVVGAGARIATGAWIDRGAVVHAGASIGTTAHVAAGAVVGRDARIGARVKIGANAHVWDGARVDSDDVIAESLRRPHRLAAPPRRLTRATRRAEGKAGVTRPAVRRRRRASAPTCTTARGMPSGWLTGRNAGRRGPSPGSSGPGGPGTAERGARPGP